MLASAAAPVAKVQILLDDFEFRVCEDREPDDEEEALPRCLRVDGEGVVNNVRGVTSPTLADPSSMVGEFVAGE